MDIDFQHDRREEVLNYCRNKYGFNAVARIITFGTLGAKAVVRDVTRVNDYPYAVGDKIAKAIPTAPGMTLEKALVESLELRQMYDTDPDVKKIIDISFVLEGLKRNSSMHACGVEISNGDISNTIPQIFLENEETGLLEQTTQFPADQCEELGTLKIDFLGLRTMTAIGRSLELINIKRKDMGLTPLVADEIPLNDPRVYEYISKGFTQGVFQLEGAGMTVFIKELFQDVSSRIAKIQDMKISDEEKQKLMDKFGEELFERLIAGISLYRPGPIHEIPKYINFMLHPDQITYSIPELKPILDATYSVIVYQEQCMFIVRELAGFSKGQADTIRKGMAK